MAGKKKKADLAAEFFGRLVAATESGEEDVVKAMLKEAKKGGLPISLHEEVNEVNWDEDYPLVKVNYELRLGAIAVAKWYSDYSGHWGGARLSPPATRRGHPSDSASSMVQQGGLS
ncbi:MAG: hypothetical protein IT486_00180 [Gammaproteobacteria bacterium]|nr:hypothetical protein [Gammaproteobacteria bacterium]